MELRIIDHKIEKLDRHGRPTKVSPAEIQHTVKLNNGECHTMKTELAPTITDWHKAMRLLRNKCELGSVNQRKVVDGKN